MSAKARPTSAGSRMAWGSDYGHARPDSQFDFGQDGIRDDPDLSPTAMEDDSVYVTGGDKGKGNSTSVVPSSSNKQSKSFLSKIGGGIRSLWATRQTEDVKGDRELHVKTTLRELIVYIVFLAILCVVTFGMTSTTMYYYTKVMSDLFLDSTHSGGGSFKTITSVEDFWKFAKSPLLKGLYWETWYNNVTVPEDQLGYIYYENKLLGVPRLRQLQVHSNSCVVHDDFKDVIRECYEAYADSLENKEPFGIKDVNSTAWFYRTQDELDGSSHWGLIARYSGAGYVQELTKNRSESAAIIDYLFDNRWVQRGTRVLFIDFTVYNANINLFCVVRLTVEFPPTGGAISQATLRTVKLIRYVTVMDYFILACEIIFCLFIFYYMIEEGIEIKKHKLSYFKSFWNILDILVIIIAIVCVAFNIYRYLSVNDLLEKLLDKPDQYSDFEFLAYCQTQFDNAIAIAVFLAWIKIFKYISFNKTMTQLSSTLGKCAKDLAGFAVMFFIIFLAFTQLGYLLFGTQVKDFSDFKNSFFTLFRIILGDFNFGQLEAANRVLGPLFFMLFVFFVFFVLINMFLAIINDTYSEVKGDMANQKNEFEMTDYFKRGYEKMLNKLHIKHDKIVDIQLALQSADINNDKQVDFDEWRHDLKTRGYADGEIEALFAKYDIDGDRVLDEDEQRKMQSDLSAQKAALRTEYDNLEKDQRPESARRSTSRVSFNDDSADDSDDDDSHTKSSRSGPSQSVSYEEFTVLSRRVDRMEHSIGSIVSKIDAVLVKLEAMEKAKLKRRETMGKILDSITESDGTSDEVKREQMEKLVREELERWDSESSITPQPSGRGASPSSSGRGGARSRSRPGSGGNAKSSALNLAKPLGELDSSNTNSDSSHLFRLDSDLLELEVQPVNLDNECGAGAQSMHNGEIIEISHSQYGSPQLPEMKSQYPIKESQSQTNTFTLQTQSSHLKAAESESPSNLHLENAKNQVRSLTPNLPGVVFLSLSPIPEQHLKENGSWENDTSNKRLRPGSSRPTSARSSRASSSNSLTIGTVSEIPTMGDHSVNSSRPTSVKSIKSSSSYSIYEKVSESPTRGDHSVNYSRPTSSKSVGSSSSMSNLSESLVSSRPTSAKSLALPRSDSTLSSDISRPNSAKSLKSSRPNSSNSQRSLMRDSAKSVMSSAESLKSESALSLRSSKPSSATSSAFDEKVSKIDDDTTLEVSCESLIAPFNLESIDPKRLNPVVEENENTSTMDYPSVSELDTVASVNKSKYPLDVPVEQKQVAPEFPLRKNEEFKFKPETTRPSLFDQNVSLLANQSNVPREQLPIQDNETAMNTFSATQEEPSLKEQPSVPVSFAELEKTNSDNLPNSVLAGTTLKKRVTPMGQIVSYSTLTKQASAFETKNKKKPYPPTKGKIILGTKTLVHGSGSKRPAPPVPAPLAPAPPPPAPSSLKAPVAPDFMYPPAKEDAEAQSAVRNTPGNTESVYQSDETSLFKKSTTAVFV